MPIHSNIIQGCFQTTQAESSSCGRDPEVCKRKLFTLAHIEMFAGFWLRQVARVAGKAGAYVCLCVCVCVYEFQ